MAVSRFGFRLMSCGPALACEYSAQSGNCNKCYHRCALTLQAFRCPAGRALARGVSTRSTHTLLRSSKARSAYAFEVGCCWHLSIQCSVTHKGLHFHVTVCFTTYVPRPVAEVSEKSQLTQALSKAQRLALSPVQRLESLLAEGGVGTRSMDSLVDEGEAIYGPPYDEFTTNIVQVSVEGPDYAELQLIDLPGLIASGSPELVKRVEGLCREYMKKPNMLMVMCCPFDDDLENQAVRKLAKEYDPQGSRTTCVLTKADKLPEGEESFWIRKVMANSGKYKLRHGYFAVMNPNQKQLSGGLKLKQAISQEQEFFNNKDTDSWWNSVRARCGSVALTTFLAKQLRERFEEQRLPQ